jgi:hypothetical protein
MKFELSTLDKYTDETVISEIRRVAALMSGETLTHDRFNELSKVHSSSVRNRFGSWIKALDAAGISEEIAPRKKVLSREEVIDAIRKFAESNIGNEVTKEEVALKLGVDLATISRRFGSWSKLLNEVGAKSTPLGRRYTEDECFENILSLWKKHGKQPTVSQLGLPPSSVGLKAYLTRWGSWRLALAAFVKKVNEPDVPSTEYQNEIVTDFDLGPQEPTLILASRTIPLSLRYRILSRDRFRCVICGASPAKDLAVELHVDHIHPWSRGGKNVEENLRSDLTPENRIS